MGTSITTTHIGTCLPSFAIIMNVAAKNLETMRDLCNGPLLGPDALDPGSQDHREAREQKVFWSKVTVRAAQLFQDERIPLDSFLKNPAIFSRTCESPSNLGPSWVCDLTSWIFEAVKRKIESENVLRIGRPILVHT